MAYLDYEAIRAQARGRWDYLLAALAPELEGAREMFPRHVPCPVHGGIDGFRLHKDYEENGGGVCNTCGSYPSGFRLLQWLKGWDFPQTLEAVVELINGGIPEVRPVRRVTGNGKGRDDEKLRQRLRRTWQEAVALQDSWAKPARLYLERRGISPATFYATGCKCHPHLAYWEQGKGEVGKFPALLSLLWDPQGQAVTLHRTYLTKDGCKAPVENPKKTMPYPSDRKLAGALVRLGQPNGNLGLAEGIETALAVQAATGMVCWAATSATLLEGAVLPHSVRRVVVWADNDRNSAGQMAALRLAARLVKEGRKVKVEVPDRPPEMKSWDWNDVLTNQGSGGFPGPGRLSRIKTAIGW